MSQLKLSTRNFLSLFFMNYFWLGIVVLLSGIIANKYVCPTSFIWSALIELTKTIGISILIASISTFASGTSTFVDKIRQLLQDIVVNRDFLGNIDSESKREALSALIKPSNRERNIYSNIEDYFNTYISQTMDVTKKCVRSNYIVDARAFYDNEKKSVAVESLISYRLYPTIDGYNEIKVGFNESQEDSSCEYVKVNTPHGERKVHPENGEKFDFQSVSTDFGQVNLATINLSEYSKKCSHLDIEIKFLEYGKDHWELLSFQALQPTDGFRHHIRCEGNLEIADYAFFVHGAKFYIDKSNNNRSLKNSSNLLGFLPG